jgi:hypothetical protein
MPLFAFGDVIPGEQQVINDRVGAGPGAEQIIALEERVVAIGGMGDDQRLHHRRVLLHEIGDAGIGVDHDLIGQPHLPTPVVLLGQDELLAVGPVLIAERHPHRGIGIHHLLGGDDLDLVGVDIQPEVVHRNLADDLVVTLDHRERPFGRISNQL